MSHLKLFRANVTIYRKRRDNAEGRPHTQEELAKEVGLSAKELGHRLNGNGRTPLSKENILKIVETLAVWETLSLQEAEKLFRSMDYPLQEIDWQAPPWGNLPAGSSPSSTSSLPLQQNEASSGQAPQAREQERSLYLQHMIQTYQQLMLPGGREVPLERIYVSLRADEMCTPERQAEHALYLQEVAALAQEAWARLPDPYLEFAALRKAVARHPKMFMLDARNWPRLFGERKQHTLTLAEVVKHHQHVVLLGDPGSGKTTLLKWLVLQFAHALSRNDTQVRVLAEFIQSGAKPGKETEELELGLAKLPVFVSIAQYARVRKPKEQPDRGVTLYEYLRSGRFLDSLRLPPGLSQETAGALVAEAVQHGLALIVLDGLDEVSDITWRRKIMEAVRRFLQEWCLLELAREERFIVSDHLLPSDRSSNQVILTTRPVGYQFDPLVDLPHYTVEEMDGRAITSFCHAWMQHVAHPPVSLKEASQWADQLHHAIFTEVHPGVRSMAGNPLLLTIMVQLAWKMRAPDGVRALPAQRVALFEEAARTFYDQREAAWDHVGITPLRLTRALGAVATALHASETAGFATEEEVRKQLHSVLTDDDQVQAVLDAAREVSGFLIARGEGIYGFLHRAVQEYFAAQHLVSRFEQATSTIMTYALNPLWREPVVLAFGLMSRPKYSEEVLSVLFTALLDLPDPAGSALPRRELLAMAACVECERVPDGIGRRVAQGLLSGYASRIESKSSDMLRQRIQQAFVQCQRLPESARMEVEEVLCGAVQAEEFAQRFAAVELIIKIPWDAPAIAESLVVAWRTYADPAGSLLLALEGLQRRRPGWFHERLLPLKRQMAEKPHLWEYVTAHSEWQHLLQILYLPPTAPFVLEQVNRDSPLTGEIITALEQAVNDSGALFRFLQRLYMLFGQSGTALARDAALALSALGERDWITSWGEHLRDQERMAQPTLAALAVFEHRTNIDFARASSLYHILLSPNLAYVHELDLALDLPHAFKLASFLARDLAPDRIPGIDLAFDRVREERLDLDRKLGFNRDPFPDLAGIRSLDLDLDLVRGFDLTLDLDLVRAREHLDEIEHLLQRAKGRWLGYADLLQNLDTALVVVELLKQEIYGSSLFIADIWIMLITTYREARKDERSQSKPATPQITPESFPALVHQLVSPNDEQRLLAREALAISHQASTLGKALIESMAELSLHFSGDGHERDKRQAETHLVWMLHKITHDQPDWICTWLDEASQTQEEIPAAQILEAIHKATSEVFETLLQVLPTTPPHVRKRLLEALKWQIRDNMVLQKHLFPLAKQVLDWLDWEKDGTIRRIMIEVLGAWQEQETAQSIGESLLKRLDTLQSEQDESTISMALAHLARKQPALRESVHAMLLQKTRTCAAALTCLWTTPTEVPSTTDTLFSLSQKELSDSAKCFNAFLEAGIDDDFWDETYHGVLVNAAQQLLEHISPALALELLQSLLERLRLAQAIQDWPTRRMMLAVIAACAETVPTMLRQAGQGKLEQLLVRGMIDAYSFNSRRFALTAISYLRTVTAAVVPALLAGCQDTAKIQQATIEAARRFQRIESDLLPALLPVLTAESTSAAYAVAHLLGALGTSATGTSTGLHERIITVLVEALKAPSSKRTVTIAGQDKGTLEDTLYEVLLQVAGWIG